MSRAKGGPAAETIHLCVGEMVFSTEPIVVSTVLGSCIAVCLFSRESSAGGMVHYALPGPPGPESPQDGFRYASVAVPRLIQELARITGAEPRTFLAKIVGGAAESGGASSRMQAGQANIAAARSLLARHGIPIVGESVAGHDGRQALFHIPSGRLQVARSAAPSKPAVTRGSGSMSTGPHKQAGPARAKAKRKVLIVDDSRTIRELLQRILRSDPDLEVVGAASDAFEADRLVSRLNPDVITLDIHMPGMTGVEWLEKLLPTKRVPVVMISSLQMQEGNEVFRALELGAVDYIQKPSFSDLAQVGPSICEKIKEASFAKVLPHRPVVERVVFEPGARGTLDTSCIVAIGASTGGTEALKQVLCDLPATIPPIVIVQHIPPVFSRAFADRLNQLCPFEVKEASDGDELKPSRVLIAPGGKQMKVERSAHGYRVRITDDDPVKRHKPSVDYLFHSVATVVGKKSVGVTLTGMGNDGAAGLLAMRKCGSRTIGQDEESSIVYGMPRVAFEAGAVETVVSLGDVAKTLLEALTRRKVA